MVTSGYVSLVQQYCQKQKYCCTKNKIQSENQSFGNMGKRKKTPKQIKESLDLSEKHDKSRYFSARGTDFELTGIVIKNDKYFHHVKNINTGEYKFEINSDGSKRELILVSDSDLKRYLKETNQ